MKTGYWHGENATILNEDEESVCILIGDYSPSELERIIEGLDNEDPDISDEYADCVLLATREEWEEQQN